MKYIKGDHVAGVNRFNWHSTDGRIKLVPRDIHGGLDWRVYIDGINLNIGRRKLDDAKRFAEAMIKRQDGALRGPTVLWVLPSLNENLVHAIGEALGVDTGTIHESKFEAAVEAAKRVRIEDATARSRA